MLLMRASGGFQASSNGVDPVTFGGLLALRFAQILEGVSGRKSHRRKFVSGFDPRSYVAHLATGDEREEQTPALEQFTCRWDLSGWDPQGCSEQEVETRKTKREMVAREWREASCQRKPATTLDSHRREEEAASKSHGSGEP